MEKVSRPVLVRAMTHAVQCKWPHNSFYETIAAFNSWTVAKDYTRQCADAAKKKRIKFKYRTVEIVKRLAR